MSALDIDPDLHHLMQFSHGQLVQYNNTISMSWQQEW